MRPAERIITAIRVKDITDNSLIQAKPMVELTIKDILDRREHELSAVFVFNQKSDMAQKLPSG